MTGPAAQPPRPPVALRIGVTGHRPGSVNAAGAPRLPAAAVPAVTATVGRVLDLMLDAARRTGAAHAGAFAPPPPDARGVVAIIVSSLAAGADQIVAEAGLARGCLLDAVLPFPDADYRTDQQREGTEATYDALMAAARARFALDGARAADTRAYEAAGLIMLANSDILIAIWDGEPGSGRGGTADMIARACAEGMPVVLIDPATPQDAAVVWSGFDDLPLASAQIGDTARAPLDSLSEVIGSLLAPPDVRSQDLDPGRWPAIRRYLRALVPFAPSPDHDATHEGSGDHAPEVSPDVVLDTYLAEHQQTRLGLLARVYPRLLQIFAGRPFGPSDRRAAPYVAAVRADWGPFLSACPETAPGLRDALETTLLPAFAFADRLATYYSLLYRGAFVACYLLASVAVALALCGLLPFFADWIEAKAVLTGLEVIIIGGILWIYVQGVTLRWHARFLEYRRLAEVLRPMRMLSLVAAPDPIGRASGRRIAEVSFVPWYARAIRRAIPLPDAQVDAEYLGAVRRAAADCQESGGNASEIEGQIAYHATTAGRLGRMEHALHVWGERLFKLTLYLGIGLLVLFACLGLTQEDWTHAMHENPWKPIKYGITFLMAFFPTLGAALSAIRVQGDFAVYADRSRNSLYELTRIRAALVGADPTIEQTTADETAPARMTPQRGAGEGHSDLALVTDRVAKAADAMQGDLAQWHVLSRARPLSLPA
ncbi:MAG: hypothetical protein IOD03_22150 [Methylocystis sp.]|nr:hypothetical protein [Rhodobacter sp.]MCA3586352.1 hypothetical protein [Methylocystis sp.]MCA3755536.1 hypothetical protein [Phenylobacterium sp.]MCA3467468.1 hypothetical protein [Rhodobacter sp.]MCA3485364.1 hypothetical protein [Rhodobacter sp.]